MLGNKCPFYNQCKAKNNRYNAKNYCKSERDSKRCPERPGNSYNKNVYRQHLYNKNNDFAATAFWIFIIIIGILIILPKIF